jgi:lipoprotein-anchoring transpeptidase ErfK/SrfK
MQRVGTGRVPTSRRAGVVAALVASAALALTLSACTSSGDASTGQQDPLSTKASGATGGPATASGSTGSSPSASPSAPAGPPVITTTAGNRRMSPAAPVTVGISNGRLTAVRMTNAAGRVVQGTLTGDGSSWRNAEKLGYDKTYKIVATGVGEDGSPVTKTSEVRTVAPDNLTMPYLVDLYGSALEDGATYGVGMIVKIHFDEHVDQARAERALQVTTTPTVTGGWYWEDAQNVYWRPQHYYAPGTEVTVRANVYGVRVGPGLYGQADQSVTFKIGAKHYSVANAKTHQVKVYFNDRLVRTMPTSMGQGGTVQGKNGPIYLWTMPGTYTVLGHENPATMSSDSYGLPANSPLGYAPEKVYWSTKISTDGIYLHQLDTTLAQQGHANVSHGCLNLNLKNAKWYYQHSRVGDLVRVIHSGGPRIQFWQGGQWDVPWATWLKHSAL